jgi:hypothetical protein
MRPLNPVCLSQPVHPDTLYATLLRWLENMAVPQA